MTERLYYKDPGLFEFEGRIVRVEREGDRYVTVLDRSAFYPTSGGQLHDTGVLGGAEIVEVRESEEGDVLHVTPEPAGDVGQRVKGEIERERRQRHRRQHTAQHILSAAFANLYDLETVSVHLGEEYGAIQFDTKVLTDEQLTSAEDIANLTVLENSPVEILFLDSEEVARLPLRKPTARTGAIRIIRIEGCDYSACGGTHVCSTGEIGLIKITGVEKARGHTLVRFLSGRQALSDYVERFSVTDHLSRNLTCAVADLPEKLGKMTAEIKELKKQVREVQKELLPVKAAKLAKNVHTRGQLKYIAEAVADVDPGVVGPLATLAAELIEGLAVLCVGERLVLAVPETSNLHAGNLARELAKETGLKGGGSNRQAQLGGAEPARLHKYMEILLEAI